MCKRGEREKQKETRNKGNTGISKQRETGSKQHAKEGSAGSVEFSGWKEKGTRKRIRERAPSQTEPRHQPQQQPMYRQLGTTPRVITACALRDSFDISGDTISETFGSRTPHTPSPRFLPRSSPSVAPLSISGSLLPSTWSSHDSRPSVTPVLARSDPWQGPKLEGRDRTCRRAQLVSDNVATPWEFHRRSGCWDRDRHRQACPMKETDGWVVMSGLVGAQEGEQPNEPVAWHCPPTTEAEVGCSDVASPE